MPVPSRDSGGGSDYFVLGGAALIIGAAAREKIRLPSFEWHFLGLAVAAVLCLSAARPAHASGKDHIQPGTLSQPQQMQQQQPSRPATPAGEQFVIERIEFVGNRRIRSDALRSRIFSREGDPYNEDTLRRDFLALWNTQYFEDVKLEVEDSPEKPNAKIIVFTLRERPVIRRIEYKGNKSVSESDILDRFKERKVGLSVESQFDPTKIKKAEVVLKELLGEHGHEFAVVRPTYERLPSSNAVKLIFNIEEGPKVKVGKITIEGNAAFSDRRIIRSMRHSRPIAIPLKITELPIMGKTYDRRKLAEDMEIGIRGLYQDAGYFQVLVKEPVTETVDLDRGGIPGPWPLVGRKHGKITNITISIVEGDVYRMGKLVIRSSDPTKGLSLKVEALRNIFPLKEGDLFSVDKIRKAMQNYTKVYGEFGFIDFTPTPQTDVDSVAKRVNLTLEFDEQKQFYVHRIDVSGNVTTRDKVIRREILLDEGDLFNNRLWEISILRLNQLDYFEPLKPETAAEIKRNLKDGTVDLTLKVKEKGKQSISFTGGVSGLAGSFLGLSYQTNNFLGLGETLTFSTEFGSRQRNFLFGFTEPYLFDRPISTGFTIFNSRFTFDQSRETSLLIGQRVQLDPNTTQNYNQNSKGFTLFASYPIKRFSFTRLGLSYGYTDTSIQAFSQASSLLFESLQFTGFAGPSALNGIHSSKISGSLSYNTVGDSPLNPTHGKSFFFSSSFEGGRVLRGNVNAVSEVFEMKYFHPINHKRNALGFRLLTAFATGYGGRELPPYERFYLGGEDSVRGFDIRTIGPVGFIPVATSTPFFFQDPTVLDGGGNPQIRQVSVPTLAYSITFPGGDLQSVGNAEYRIPIVGPVSMALFFDAGINGALRRGQLQLSDVGLQSLRTQFPSVAIPTNIQFAEKSNFKLRTSTGIEFVVQLPIVNAPFRLYWAYNLNRYYRTITAPAGTYALSDQLIQSLPPGVLESQILPQLNLQVANPQKVNFFDPKRTFRFTVSRTF
jgi:outer membrane protein insertion porin family